MGLKQSWAMGWAGSAVLLALMGTGCGGDDDTSGMSPGGSNSDDGTCLTCSTGVSLSCVGPGGCAGTQLCGGNHCLLRCECNDQGSSMMPPSDAGSTPSGMLDGAVSMLDGGMQTPGGHTDPDGGMKPPQHEKDSGTTPPAHDKEDCSNGIDDDGDGDPDCADDDCTASSCVGAAPSGWTGPSVVYVGSDPPNCGGNYAEATLSGGTAVDADPADCSTCSCSNSTAACASIVNIITTTDAQCDGTSCTDSVGEACKTLDSSCFASAGTGYVSMQLPSGLASCSPTAAQDPTVGDASWKKEVRACTATDKLHIGGCAQGEVCAPKTPFEGSICVSKTGDLACPNAAYSEKHVYYKGVNDTRSCSECGCDHDCDYAWRVEAAGASCSAPFALDSSDSCVMVSPTSGEINVGVQITGTGACSATGGQPTGSATPTGAVTVCCQP
jgi:hypothetical protein